MTLTKLIKVIQKIPDHSNTLMMSSILAILGVKFINSGANAYVL